MKHPYVKVIFKVRSWQWRRQGAIGVMAPHFGPTSQMAPQVATTKKVAPTRMIPFYIGNMSKK